MEKITRKGIAFDSSQLKRFDLLILKKGYKNRSEAIRDLIRNALAEDTAKDDNNVMIGTLTIVYNHHKSNVQQTLTHMQHEKEHQAPGLIISTMHSHIDNDNCLEVLVLKGKVKEIRHYNYDIIMVAGMVGISNDEKNMHALNFYKNFYGNLSCGLYVVRSFGVLFSPTKQTLGCYDVLGSYNCDKDGTETLLTVLKPKPKI